jgi:hypothetical protein
MRPFRRRIERAVAIVIAGSAGVAAAYACKPIEGAPIDDEPDADAVAPPPSPPQTPPSASEASADTGTPPPLETFPDESSFDCGTLPQLLDDFDASVPLDYLALRTASVAFQYFTRDDASVGPITTIAATGVACASALDAGGCLADLDASEQATDAGACASFDYTACPGWFFSNVQGAMEPNPKGYEWLAYTRGDGAGKVKNAAGVTQLAGPIDSLAKARMILRTVNVDFECLGPPQYPHKAGWRRNADGSYDFIVVGFYCDKSTTTRFRAHVAPDGGVELGPLYNDTSAVCGRRPAGLTAASTRDVLAHAAHLEAASVVAFRRLELELRRFGAPASLVRRAQKARQDEIRHARETARLAKKRGAIVPPVEVAPFAIRSLLDVAIENAVEGCVRETYGALVAAFQAARAEDPAIRTLMRAIAPDEATHAELADDVARFLERKLTNEERAIVAQKREEAIAALHAEIACSSPSARFGLPSPEEARALYDAYRLAA